MAQLNPYLTFHNNCRAAMEFYKKCFGGKLQIVTFGDMPSENIPPDAKDLVMHASLVKGSFVLMASDSIMGDPVKGDTMSLFLDCASKKEIQQLFGALAEQGQITAPLHDAPWGAHFGMVTDRFGMQWMLHFNLPKKKTAPIKGKSKPQAKAKKEKAPAKKKLPTKAKKKAKKAS